MSKSAVSVLPIAGGTIEVEVTLIAIERGLGATVDYAIMVWQVSGNYRSVIVGGEKMLPPEIITEAKTKLWESIKP